MKVFSGGKKEVARVFYDMERISGKRRWIGIVNVSNTLGIFFISCIWQDLFWNLYSKFISNTG